MRVAPAAAISLIKQFEGCRLEPYYDCVGFPTIGWGRLLSRQRNADLAQWPPITEQEAHTYLLSDVACAARSVQRLIKVPLTDSQFAALIDFVFNLGAALFEISTLRRVINREDYDQAEPQLRRWIYAGGRPLKGLIRRRDAECVIWNSQLS